MKRTSFKWKKIYKANSSYSPSVFTEKTECGHVRSSQLHTDTQLINCQLSPANNLVDINEVPL